MDKNTKISYIMSSTFEEGHRVPYKSFFANYLEINAVAVLPDGERVITATDARTMTLWDVTGEDLSTFSDHSDSVNAVVILPDGEHALSASDDKTLKLWDLATAEALVTFSDHFDCVTAVAILPGR